MSGKRKEESTNPANQLENVFSSYSCMTLRQGSVILVYNTSKLRLLFSCLNSNSMIDIAGFSLQPLCTYNAQCGQGQPFKTTVTKIEKVHLWVISKLGKLHIIQQAASCFYYVFALLWGFLHFPRQEKTTRPRHLWRHNSSPARSVHFHG